MNIFAGTMWGIACVCWIITGILNIKLNNYGLSGLNGLLAVLTGFLSLFYLVGGR